MKECPKCGRTMYEDCIGTEFEGNTYYDQVVAHCDHCNKSWIWTDIFTYADSTELEEINDEDY